MNKQDVKETLYKSINQDPHALKNPDVAHLTINENKVLASNTVPGLEVDVKELPDGVDIHMELEDNRIMAHSVHLCFGVIPKEGIQRILLDVVIGKNSKIALTAHCSFPFAVNVQHIMDGRIHLKEGADYTYIERHVHSDSGGVQVVPKAIVQVDSHAHFRTDFELLRGRVGKIDIEYDVTAKDYGLVEMTALISGSRDDKIFLREMALLEGEYARAALTSKIAVRDNAHSEVYNKITAMAPYCRGHVDCKEIIKGNGTAIATPIVDVRDSRAHVTHEAAIGSVDKKQLETLMARGLNEDEASELIIKGMLS